MTETTTPDTPDGAQPPAESAPAATPAPADPGPAKVELTQEQIDAMIAKATARATKAAEAKAAEDARRAAMDDTERLAAERDEARQAADAAAARAHQVAVTAEAKVAAMAAQVKPERIDAFLKVADLSAIEPGDDGGVDAKAIADAVAATLTAFPEFKATTPPGRGSAGGFNGDQPDARPKTLEGAVAAAIAAQ